MPACLIACLLQFAGEPAAAAGRDAEQQQQEQQIRLQRFKCMFVSIRNRMPQSAVTALTVKQSVFGTSGSAGGGVVIVVAVVVGVDGYCFLLCCAGSVDGSGVLQGGLRFVVVGIVGIHT